MNLEISTVKKEYNVKKNLCHLGMLIAYERLKRNWSQAGLCEGICSVSYLSKIEKGISTPSEEIIQLLLKRLDIIVDGALESEADMLAENAYEKIFSHSETFNIDYEDIKIYKGTSGWPDLYLIYRLLSSKNKEGEGKSAEDGDFVQQLVSSMDKRQLAVFSMVRGSYSDATLYYPNAYTFYMYGKNLYEIGRYREALEPLNQAYYLSCQDGYVNLMIHIKMVKGACYSNLQDLDRAKTEYKIAHNISTAIIENDVTETIAYNIHSTEIEMGLYEQAYAYFSHLPKSNKLDFHKLAIACEKLGKPDEAFMAIEKGLKIKEANKKSNEIIDEMLHIIKFRLEHGDFVHNQSYGEQLLGLFDRIRKTFPAGFAIFHLPWVVQWYANNRQYKKIIELMGDFPNISNLIKF